MARIEATGRYMPKKVVDNSYFSAGSNLFESVQDYFNGYVERRHCSGEENGLSMAIAAARDALSSSSYKAEDIDAIIGWICPNQYLYGEDLNLVQYEIGALNASVLPINTTCSSFLSALNLADSLISSGRKKCILIIISTNWTNSILNTETPNYAFAGDGAAAVVVDAEGDSFIDVCEQNYSKWPIFKSMSMASPVLSGKKEYFTITEPEGISMAKDMILVPISVGKQLLDKNPDVHVDKVVLHQSGLRMMEMWLEKLGLPFDRVRHTLEHFANMTAANIPVSLDYWVKAGEIKRGDTLLFFSPAAGGHCISMLWRF